MFEQEMTSSKLCRDLQNCAMTQLTVSNIILATLYKLLSVTLLHQLYYFFTTRIRLRHSRAKLVQQTT